MASANKTEGLSSPGVSSKDHKASKPAVPPAVADYSKVEFFRPSDSDDDHSESALSNGGSQYGMKAEGTPSPTSSQPSTPSAKTAREKAKKARQKARDRARKAAASGTSTPVTPLSPLSATFSGAENGGDDREGEASKRKSKNKKKKKSKSGISTEILSPPSEPAAAEGAPSKEAEPALAVEPGSSEAKEITEEAPVAAASEEVPASEPIPGNTAESTPEQAPEEAKTNVDEPAPEVPAAAEVEEKAPEVPADEPRSVEEVAPASEELKTVEHREEAVPEPESVKEAEASETKEQSIPGPFSSDSKEESIPHSVDSSQVNQEKSSPAEISAITEVVEDSPVFIEEKSRSTHESAPLSHDMETLENVDHATLGADSLPVENSVSQEGSAPSDGPVQSDACIQSSAAAPMGSAEIEQPTEHGSTETKPEDFATASVEHGVSNDPKPSADVVIGTQAPITHDDAPTSETEPFGLMEEFKGMMHEPQPPSAQAGFGTLNVENEASACTEQSVDSLPVVEESAPAVAEASAAEAAPTTEVQSAQEETFEKTEESQPEVSEEAKAAKPHEEAVADSEDEAEEVSDQGKDLKTDDNVPKSPRVREHRGSYSSRSERPSTRDSAKSSHHRQLTHEQSSPRTPPKRRDTGESRSSRSKRERTPQEQAEHDKRKEEHRRDKEERERVKAESPEAKAKEAEGAAAADRPHKSLRRHSSSRNGPETAPGKKLFSGESVVESNFGGPITADTTAPAAAKEKDIAKPPPAELKRSNTSRKGREAEVVKSSKEEIQNREASSSPAPSADSKKRRGDKHRKSRLEKREKDEKDEKKKSSGGIKGMFKKLFSF